MLTLDSRNLEKNGTVFRIYVDGNGSYKIMRYLTQFLVTICAIHLQVELEVL